MLKVGNVARSRCATFMLTVVTHLHTTGNEIEVVEAAAFSDAPIAVKRLAL
jgi:hypothetical protein